MGWGDKLKSKAKAAVGKVVKAGKKAAGALKKAAGAVGSKVKAGAKGIANGIKKAAGAIGKKVKTEAKNLAGAVKKTAGAIGSKVKALAKGISGGIKSGINKAKDKVGEISEEIGERNEEIFNYMEEYVKDRGQVVTRGIVTTGAMPGSTTATRVGFFELDVVLEFRKKVIEEYPILGVRDKIQKAYNDTRKKRDMERQAIGKFIYGLEIPVISEFAGSLYDIEEAGEKSTVEGTVGSLLNGVGDWVVGTADGVVNLVIDPYEAMQGISKMGAYPEEIFPVIGASIEEYVDKNITGESATAETRAEATGYVISEFASWFVGIGEAKAALTASKAGSTAGKVATHLDDIGRAGNYLDEAGKVGNYLDEAGKVGGDGVNFGNAVDEVPVEKVIPDVGSSTVDSPFDEVGKLKPDVKYKAGEFNYSYETDSMGRLEKFSTDDLKLTERANRLPHNPNTPGKIEGDHAGHIVGDRFGGSPELDNLVSQSSNVNLSKYKKLENQWAKAIEQGKNVKVEVSIKYDGDGLRPTEFKVRYEIGGKPTTIDISN